MSHENRPIIYTEHNGTKRWGLSTSPPGTGNLGTFHQHDWGAWQMAEDGIQSTSPPYDAAGGNHSWRFPTPAMLDVDDDAAFTAADELMVVNASAVFNGGTLTLTLPASTTVASGQRFEIIDPHGRLATGRELVIAVPSGDSATIRNKGNTSSSVSTTQTGASVVLRYVSDVWMVVDGAGL